MHLTSALVNQKAGVGIQLIAYRGTAPASVDVLAGHIPLAVLDIPASKQLINDGKLKALDTLNAAFGKALSDPAAIEKIRILGAEPAPSSPEAFAKFIRGESEKWGKLIAETGIKGE